MTKRELNQLYYINRGIEMIKRRIEERECEATRITTQLSDMPKASGMQDKLSRIVADIIDDKKMLMLKMEEAEIERRRLEYYIDSVGDAKIRLYMSLRFINGFSWLQVARYAENDISEDGPRKAIERYLREANDNGKLAKIR